MNQLGSSSQIALIVDRVRTSSPDHFGIFSNWQWEFLREKLLRSGIRPHTIQMLTLERIAELGPEVRTIVGMGEEVLRHFTTKKGIDKWQLSPLTTHDGRKFIPTFDFGRVQKQYELNLFQELAFRRAHQENVSRSYNRAEERFLLNPSLAETMAVLDELKFADELAIDIETGYGQINTVGIADSSQNAISINVLPDRCGPSAYYELWAKIAAVLEGPSRKIFQNFIYDVSYFSAYGISVENIDHDTMFAMKVLWPELDMNLGNVGRIYTNRPYWKDDGKVEGQEGKKKDWGNVRDWVKHYTYNCRDVTGTFEAKQNQVKDLEARGLVNFYQNYVMKLTGPILEMSTNGMPLDLDRRGKLQTEIEARVQYLTKRLHAAVGEELNPRSPKQMKSFFARRGIKLPKKYDKESGTYKESADASSLRKVRLKNPLPELDIIAEMKTLDTALSRYINFTPREDGRLSYSLCATGTETLRWSGGKDAWGRGFNIQTIPREGGEVSIKSMFVAPEGQSFMEIDLRQAESRFVAYDSADKKLIDMLESGEDVHKYVALEILKGLGKSAAEYSKDWRQLGKKAGHGANYAMKESVFSETVFNEMGMQLTKKEARIILDSYYLAFPGIPRWHQWVRTELNRKRKLTAPSGWERYFYGRFGDDMFKEAYAWRPQHTIPWITNHLMLHLQEERKNRNINFDFLVQVHDSLILLIPDESLESIAKICLNHKRWHPLVLLAGGQMQIPTEVKFGKCMADLKEWGE